MNRSAAAALYDRAECWAGGGSMFVGHFTEAVPSHPGPTARRRKPCSMDSPTFANRHGHAGEFDAVMVSACAHSHAFATLPALRLGKHVDCGKPLTCDVWAKRVIGEATARAKIATQIGANRKTRKQEPCEIASRRYDRDERLKIVFSRTKSDWNRMTRNLPRPRAALAFAAGTNCRLQERSSGLTNL